MIKKAILNIIQGACALDEIITMESELKLLSIDSLSFVEAVISIEEMFEIEFEIEEMDVLGWKTVGDIVHSVEEKINERK